MRNIRKRIAFAMVSLAVCNAMSTAYNEDNSSEDENLQLAIDRSLMFQGGAQNNAEV